MNKNYSILLALAVLAALYPVVFSSYITVALTVLMFTGWASSWNILGGWAGQLSLGHATFVGLGAYFVAIGSSQFGLAPWWAILIGMAVAAVLAFFLGQADVWFTRPLFQPIDHCDCGNHPIDRH